jgi:hypothetical protein
MKQASQPDPSNGTAPAFPDQLDRTLHKLENLDRRLDRLERASSPKPFIAKRARRGNSGRS